MIASTPSKCCLTALFLCLVLPGLADSAELVLTNGRIYTVDAEQPWAEAVAIEANSTLAVALSCPGWWIHTRIPVVLRGGFTHASRSCCAVSRLRRVAMDAGFEAGDVRRITGLRARTGSNWMP
jgi:hypothetical protein